jgi:hypothetical protein
MLYAFYLEHERCGKVDSNVEDERVWMSCTFGAIISQNLQAAHYH